MSISNQGSYGVVIDREVAVPARDGTGLMTDIFRPSIRGKAAEGPFPVVLCRTPYGREELHQEGAFFAGNGYICAVQDWRQSKSDYDTKQFRPKYEAFDGYDAIEWLAAQPWSTGKVGTWGHSARGQTIQAVLALRPPGLKSAFIIDSGLNYGANYARMNGAFAQAFRLRMCLLMASKFAKDPVAKDVLKDAYQDPSKYFSCFTRPHALIKKGETVLSLSPHYENRYIKISQTADLDDEFWKDAGKSDEERIMEWKDIPICLLSGWYGNHVTANLQKFTILKDRFKSPVMLFVGHWEHSMASTFAGGVDFGPDSDVNVYGKQRLRWFDETLKGMDTGMLEKPGMHYFVMGGGKGTKNGEGRLNHGGKWAHSQSWPPSHVKPVSYFLHEDGVLSTLPPEKEDSSCTYTFDPRDPVPTVGGNFREYSSPAYSNRVTWMPDGGAQDQRANADKAFCKDNLPLSTREDVRVFQTPPLEEDTEVTGELVARLWVSSTAPDTDFTIKIMDVYPSSQDYPEGFAMNLHDGIVRMRYRNGRRKAKLIEPGKIYEVTLPFNSTSNLFKRGHRIRVDISSSNFPRYDVNPNTGRALGVQGPVRTAENTLYHSKEYPSQVILPVAAKG